MRSVNKVTFIGHLAADSELRETKSGNVLATFPIAINRNAVNEEGEKYQAVDFFRIIAWGKLGQICGEYLVKGMAVYISGRLNNRHFDDENGVRHYRTEIVAEDLNILTWKRFNNSLDSNNEKNDEIEKKDESVKKEKEKELTTV